MVNSLLFFPPDDIPEIRWTNQDDLCDCTFQRIGEWTNPYIAKTLRIRFCCVWEEFAKMFPDLFQSIDAGYDHNAKEFVHEPMEWNGEFDMPKALWHRQIQAITGKPLDEIRMKAGEPPRGVIRGS